MGVFDDKKFEELDWISQATEPMDSQLNDVLSALPEELIIDFTIFNDLMGNYSSYLSLDKAISHLASKANIEISWSQRSAIQTMFKFELEGEIELNYETKTLNGGTLRLLKLGSTMDEKVLEGLLGADGIDQISGSNMFIEMCGLSRANDIMELLGGCEAGLKTRSPQRKRNEISSRLKKLFKTNEWKIKDTELANKVGFWIRDYIISNDLAAYANFCRLKVMTHKDQPIYSMEEVK